jgi:HlyD family secretion protein
METTTREAAVKTAAPKNNARRKSSRRWLPWAGGVVLLALIVAGLWPKPLPVEVVKVATGSLRSTVNEEGKTRIKQRFLVSAPVTGQLRRIPFKAGAEVTAGETVLAVIDPVIPTMLDARSRALAEARRDTAAANLERARASHKFAASELKRFEKLFAEKTISIQELEQAQWRETAAAKELAAAESAVRQAEAELAEFTGRTSSTNREPIEVKSPITGRVLKVVEESSRVVAAGTALMELGNPADLEVVIEVLSRDGAAIQPGTRVELEQWGGSEPLQARVRLVEPAAFTKVSALGVEEQRVNVIADITTPVEKRANLGDNFRVEARIVTWEADKVLKVSSGAVFRRGNESAVFLIRMGKAALQPVTVGRTSGTETEITQGLSEGEEVIIYPGDRINDGDRVRVITVKM